MTQTFTPQHLSPDSINQLVNYLPDYIKAALLEKSNELEYSLEATIEMAISNFLDTEALSFEDCLLAQRLKNEDK
ncbi:MAG: hypothetical protein KME35_00425 [Aphanocapsa sp. GSE-SYN-MK-11-07L]|jgi:hypothetical protein|nr:hypothetical protein [Aphanocapsa sp. GSE-SYN-MK-11-07L]